MSNFPFISENILRSNLDMAFDHIVDLLTLSHSEQYKNKTILVSSLRKTIIIHTASIIEALLLWKLKETCQAEKVKLDNEWKYLDIKVLHHIEDGYEIIAGSRKKEEKDLDKLDFLRITDLCEKYRVLKTKALREDIDKVRVLRNRLHIGGLSEMEKEYRKEDLEFCFNVAKRVKINA